VFIGSMFGHVAMTTDSTSANQILQTSCQFTAKVE